MILAYEKSDLETSYLVELSHRLQLAGHIVSFGSKTQHGLEMNVKRITRFKQSEVGLPTRLVTRSRLLQARQQRRAHV